MSRRAGPGTGNGPKEQEGAIPAIDVSTTPAELIVLRGQPSLAPVAATDLLEVRYQSRERIQPLGRPRAHHPESLYRLHREHPKGGTSAEPTCMKP